MISNKESQDKARRYAFLLLKFRLRSEQEMCLRLRQKGYAPEAIKSTVSFLKEKNFIDDDAFAREWIASRLKKPFGRRRIAQELRLKGIDKKIIEQQLGKALPENAELETAVSLAKKRFSQLKNVEPVAARRRIYAYLIRRGFLPETASDSLDQL